MDFELTLDEPRPDAPAFRFRRGPLFWRVAIVAFVLMELVLWLHLRPLIPFRPRYVRIMIMLFWGPKVLLRSVALGLLVAFAADLVFRLVVRPGMVRWYNPRPRDRDHSHPLPFFLKAGERVLSEVPARRAQGRSRSPGALIRTNHALYFYPYAWDAEAWALPLGHLEAIERDTPRRRVLHWVSGYPDNVVVVDDSGETTRFVVADPAVVLDTFATTVARPRLRMS